MSGGWKILFFFVNGEQTSCPLGLLFFVVVEEMSINLIQSGCRVEVSCACCVGYRGMELSHRVPDPLPVSELPDPVSVGKVNLVRVSEFSSSMFLKFTSNLHKQRHYECLPAES